MFVGEQGKLIVISGPSGAGKTSVCKKLRSELGDIFWSISATTRPKRPNEVDGTDYYFLDKEEFLEKIKEGEFLEYAEVHGHYYGTLKHKIVKVIKAGRDCLVEIDVQGAQKIRQNSDFRSLLIFISAPDLRERLELRGHDNKENIDVRMNNVKKELAEVKNYDHCIENVNLEQTVLALKEIIAHM